MKTNNKNKLSRERIKAIRDFINSLKLTNSSIEKLNIFQLKNYIIINQALTHCSASSPNNYEKLEFKGDAVLRLIASEFIENNYPEMNVGERSELRSQLVSDNWLANVGEQIGIFNVILIGAKTLGDHSAKSTIQAEATEALIGALYECLKDLDSLQQWLCPYWLEASNKVLADPHKKNYKSALQEWSQGKGFLLPDYKTDEQSQKHGYEKRFIASVFIKGKLIAQGWGGSRKAAEKEAAHNALITIEKTNKELLINNSTKS